MYKIKLSKSVKKFLKKHELVARKFFQKVQILHKNPYIHNLDTRLLKGEKHRFRLRIGKYRFLYELRDEEVLIYFYEANSRGDIYK